MNNPIEILVKYLIENINSISSSPTSQEVNSKFDSLLDTKIRQEDIDLLKDFFQICINKIKNMIDLSNRYINTNPEESNNIIKEINYFKINVEKINTKIENFIKK